MCHESRACSAGEELDLAQGVSGEWGGAPGTMTLKDTEELAQQGGRLGKEGMNSGSDTGTRMWEAPVIKECTLHGAFKDRVRF